MTPDLLKMSFRATGILPVDKTQIPAEAFAPSAALDRLHHQPTLEPAPAPESAPEPAPAPESAPEPAPESTSANDTPEEDLITLPITAEELAGLQGLVIEVEGGDPISLDLSGIDDMPFVPFIPSQQDAVNNMFGLQPATSSAASKKKTQHLVAIDC